MTSFLHPCLFFLIYLFVYSRHEVHSMNTHSAERRLKKQTIQNGVQDTEAGEITGLQTLFATALKTEPCEHFRSGALQAYFVTP